MSKSVIFAFRGDPMCFIHVLLNALDMEEKGMEGRIVIEGEVVKIIPEVAQDNHFLNKLYAKASEKNLFDGACRACSHKLGVAEAIEQLGIKLIGDMAGHPAISGYLDKEYNVVTF